jgi:hypothetical protein
MANMTPEDIIKRFTNEPSMAQVLLLAHIAWSLERIATAMNEGVEVECE